MKFPSKLLISLGYSALSFLKASYKLAFGANYAESLGNGAFKISKENTCIHKDPALYNPAP